MNLIIDKMLKYDCPINIKGYTLKKKGTVQNLKKRFRGRQNACKCVHSFKKRIKRSTEPLKDLALYPSEDPFFFKTFLSSVDQKTDSVRKYETFRVSH